MSCMKSFIIYFLLAQTIWCELTTVPQGKGYIEDDAATKKKCATLHLELGLSEDHYMAKAMQSDCINSDRSMRKKRGLFVVAGLLIIGGAVVVLGVGGIVYAVFRVEPSLNSSNKISEQTEEILRALIKTGQMDHQQMLKFQEQISKEQFDQIRAKLFEKGNLDTVMTHFNFETLKTLKELGFDTTLGLEFLKEMDYKFNCGNTTNHYQLDICGPENPTRKYGQVELTAPIGNFIEGGLAFRYYDVPRYVITTEAKKVMSAGKCEKIGTHFKCQPVGGNCSALEYKNCPKKMAWAENGIVSFELGDATYIATTQKDYSVFSNVSPAGMHQKVPDSGHFLFQAPHDAFVRFDTHPPTTFYGRHDQLIIRSIIDVREKVVHFNHAELEEWNKEEKLAEKGLTNLQMLNLHASYGWHWDLDSLIHFFEWLPKDAKIVLGIVAAGIMCCLIGKIVKCVVQCRQCLVCCGCCGKKNNRDVLDV